MAGFAQFGDPGFRTAPPRIQAVGAPTGYLQNINIPSQPVDYANFYKEMSGTGAGADTSPEHMENAFMARSGIGNTGRQNISPAESPYGFGAQDYNEINQFMFNPYNQGNVDKYKALISRISPPMQRSGQFDMYTQPQFQQTMMDMPQRLGLGYGTIPPPTLQNMSIPLPYNTTGLRF